MNHKHALTTCPLLESETPLTDVKGSDCTIYMRRHIKIFLQKQATGIPKTGRNASPRNLFPREGFRYLKMGILEMKSAIRGIFTRACKVFVSVYGT